MDPFKDPDHELPLWTTTNCWRWIFQKSNQILGIFNDLKWRKLWSALIIRIMGSSYTLHLFKFFSIPYIRAIQWVYSVFSNHNHMMSNHIWREGGSGREEKSPAQLYFVFGFALRENWNKNGCVWHYGGSLCLCYCNDNNLDLNEWQFTWTKL